MKFTPDIADFSTTMRRIATHHVHICKHCSKILGPVFRPGDFVFGQQTGWCDCSWKCCEHTHPEKHTPHMTAREATPEEIATLPASWHEFYERTTNGQ